MNKRSIQISASVMCLNWLNAEKDLAVLGKKSIDLLHWDIIDGTFAPDFTMGSSIIHTLRNFSTLPADYHLMAIEPSRLFPSLSLTPQDTVTIHQEACRNLHRDLLSIRKLGCRVGLAISPGTPLEALEYVIEEVDVVLLMTVNPGFKGQPLIPQMLRKIEKLRLMIEHMNLNVQIEVDGCVSPTVVADMVTAGADILVGGSSGLFRKDLPLEASIDDLRHHIELGLQKRAA